MATVFQFTPSTMAVATRPFDIFINHRGPDVKNTVASTLYRWLTDKGLQVFLDQEEFEPPQELLPTIKDAISTSSAHIAIFSKHYAESPWCLDELCLMVETKAPIIAVYYDVEPWELRRIEKGAYADAFAQHVQKGRYEPQNIEAWKGALVTISNEHGLVLNGPGFNGDLGKLFKTTVDAAVLKALPKVQLYVAEHPVGLDEAVNDFEKFRSKYWQDDQVNIFGIVGMPGLGKTTLAKQLYNREHSSFSGSSFLLDVHSSRKTLETLQSQLLKDLLRIKKKFYNTSQGLSTLKDRLNSCKSKKFFIVLDGIHDKDQLDALFVKALTAGSLIIVTSRDKGLLNLSGISLHHEMKPLDPKNARELFCWNAFEQRKPLYGFEDLVEECLRKCNGLPCCLKDIGEYLRKEYILEEWRGELEKCSHEKSDMVGSLKRDLDKFFQEKSSKVIEEAYNDLEEEQRQIFLDIACFFVGEDKQLATRIWNPEPKWKGARCLKILEAKCLVESDCGRLKMHHPFQVLGKYIAKKKSPYRICALDQGKDVVDQWKKGMEIRGIMAATGNQHDSRSFFRALFEKMQMSGDHSENNSQTSGLSVGLKLLITKGHCFDSEFRKLSTDLVWLRWYDYPHRSISHWLPMPNLRVLEIGGDHIQNLWQDKAPLQLRELQIRRHSLEEIPKSIGSLTYLEKIVLDCGKCICTHHTLPEAFCSIRSLQHLEFHCQGLRSLPNGFENLTKLEHIDCSGCSELQRIPSSFCHLPQLKYLNLERCKNLSIQPDILEKLRKLEQEQEHFTFISEVCEQVLPMEITSDQTARKTVLGTCNDLQNNQLLLTTMSITDFYEQNNDRFLYVL